jgi:hypothetical protein
MKAWIDPCPAKITRMKRRKREPDPSGKPNPEKEVFFIG